MGYPQEVKALFSAFLFGAGGSISAHTYDTFPDNDDISLSPHGTADTEGDYTAIVTSNGSARTWTVGAHGVATTLAGDYKFTIATGASGSETVRIVLPARRLDLSASGQQEGVYYNLPFPIHVPSGTRLAGRVKSGQTAGDVDIVEEHALSLRA